MSARYKRDRDRELSSAKIQSWHDRYQENPTNQLIQNTVNNVGITHSSINAQKVGRLSHTFDYSLKKHGTKATNQGHSGRCWMFAGLNLLRHQFIEKMDLLDHFEFSEAYLFFWDKLERSNSLLQWMIDHPEHKLGSRAIDYKLHYHMSDGGHWNYFANLVEKYGLVPKSVMPETFQSGYSNQMNQIIRNRLYAGVSQIYALIHENKRRGKTSGRRRQLKNIKDQIMEQIYGILVKCLGRPPSKFTWNYRTQKQEQRQSMVDLTPVEFAQQVFSLVEINKVILPSEWSKIEDQQAQKIKQKLLQSLCQIFQAVEESDEDSDEISNEDLDSATSEQTNQVASLKDFVILAHLPSTKMKQGKVYQIKYSEQMSEGDSIKFLNLSISDLKKYARDSLLAGLPVWFAGDVSHGFHPWYSVLDDQFYDHHLLFGKALGCQQFDKGKRIDFDDVSSNHAMLLTGVNFEGNEPISWQVENSWGYYDHLTLGLDGFLFMDNSWFEHYLTEIVVHRSLLSRWHRNQIDHQDPILLEPWGSISRQLMIQPIDAPQPQKISRLSASQN